MRAAATLHRPLRWPTAAAVAAVGVLLAVLWRSGGPPASALPPMAPPAPPVTLPAPLPVSEPAAAPAVATVAPARAAPTLDGTAPDLRRLYDDHASSEDAGARRMAARAFTACIPLFVPASGTTPSPEPLIDSLPASARAEREQAYRTLFARCHGFVGERAETVAGMQARLAGDRPAQDPGTRARAALLSGDVEAAGRIAAEVLSAADPAAVASFSGVAIRLAQGSGSAADFASVQHALAVDAALPLVACELGLDCSAQSLPALQLCAVEGACSGDLPARLATRLGAAGPDPAAVEAQRERLRKLLVRGGTLDDLR